MIKNKAVVNEDTSGNVHQLQSEIKRLRQLVDRLRSKHLSLFSADTLNKESFHVLKYTYMYTYMYMYKLMYSNVCVYMYTCSFVWCFRERATHLTLFTSSSSLCNYCTYNH